MAWFIKTVRDSLGKKPVFTYGDDTPEAILEKQEASLEEKVANAVERSNKKSQRVSDKDEYEK